MKNAEREKMNAVCLTCRSTLPLLSKQEQGSFRCECGAVIPYTHGIYQFASIDEFYEGKFTETYQRSGEAQKILSFFLRLASIDGNEERVWQRSKRLIGRLTSGRKLQILNIGAGGGHGFLNELGQVTAIDLSLASLLKAQEIYEACYQADVQQIPFPDQSFDLVFSAHLLGHIPHEQKTRVIEEIYRVTKPGGFSLHSIECEADNRMYRRAKQHPELYQKYFKDMFGHYGLELPSAAKRRFREARFEPVFELSDYCKGFVRPVGSYKVFFGAPEFRQAGRMFRALAALSEILTSHKLLRFLSGFLFYPLTLLNRLGGPDAVDSVKLLYQKKA